MNVGTGFRMVCGLWCMTVSGGLLSGQESQSRRNVILIVSDDHRHDFMGSHPDSPAFLETPHLDRMAAEGTTFENAFVSTALCSPSRASMLTGQFMHRHQVVDNQRPVRKGTVFFPSHLQRAGYRTGFVGKWHMGHQVDEPRPGFDHWVSFKGQGTYYDPVVNINGDRQALKGYTADRLTDRALAWLSQQEDTQPFFLYLSFKSVHYPFMPAERHLGRYQGKPINYPPTMANTERNYRTQPRWVRNRRFSIHGIDHMETGAFDDDPVPSFDNLYYRICETVHGLDENIGRVLDFVRDQELSDTTTVIYTSDNGFELGEHGFYDKRDAFEESIRVPLLVVAPGAATAGGKIRQLVQNIDLAPSILEMCGALPPGNGAMDGRSWLPLLKGEPVTWRDHILYEYHWEWNFPATPTTFALRDERYKYIFYHGLWDANGLYDLKTDPHEQHNLIHVPAYRDRVTSMRKQLFEELSERGALNIPVRPPRGERLDQRKLPR